MIANRIEAILSDIGSEKFIAIVSDGGANVAAARKLISERHKHIFDISCIAHRFNLISKDLLKNDFANQVLRRANTLATFFKSSHQAGAILEQEIKLNSIVGGGIKTFVRTRWTSYYDTLQSIVRLQVAFVKVNL